MEKTNQKAKPTPFFGSNLAIIKKTVAFVISYRVPLALLAPV
jgi:hypothetical protein